MSSASAQASRGINVSRDIIGASGVLTMNNGSVICDVLLELTLANNPILKTTGVNQATVTNGSITNCSGGLASNGTVLTPINVQYASFAGTLPDIESIFIIAPNAAFSLNTIIGTCLYAGELIDISFDDVDGDGTIDQVTFRNDSIPRSGGSFFCPSSGAIAGELNTILGSEPTITLSN